MSDTVSPDVPNMFSKPSNINDAILLTEDKKLYVSKGILSVCSPVFAAKFEVNSTVPFTGKFADLVEFLQCMYPNSMRKIDQTNIDVVLPLADEYQVMNLKKNAEEFLLHNVQKLDKSSSLETLVHYLYLCDKYGLKHVMDKAVTAVALRRYSKVCKLYDFKALKLSTKFKILSRRMENLEEPALEVLMDVNRLCEHKKGDVSTIGNSYRKNSVILNELLEYGMDEHQTEAERGEKRQLGTESAEKKKQKQKKPKPTEAKTCKNM